MKPHLTIHGGMLAAVALLVSSCTHLAAVDMHPAKTGMTREQAIASILVSSTRYSLKNADTEYLLFRTMPSFTAAYSDYPYVVQFVRLENGKVVDRGVVDAAEEKKIQQVSPGFELREWQSKEGIPTYAPDRSQ